MYGATFADVGEHSPIAGIRRGVAAFKAAGADAIVAVGGGPPIDAAKVILHFVQEERGGPFLRQIAIPTTLSAAEFTVGSYSSPSGAVECVVYLLMLNGSADARGVYERGGA